MEKVILVIGILIGLCGVVALIRPDFYRKALKFFMHGKLVYIAAGLRIVLGVVFLISALSCSIPWIIIIFGILFLAAGITMFAVKLEKLKNMLDWFGQRSPLAIRLFAVIALVIAGIILYAVQ